MKYVKSFSNFVNEDTQGLRDYSDPTAVNYLNMRNIPPAAKQSPDDIMNNSEFQKIQTEMQKILLPYLKKHEPNADQNDAVQASDRFCSQIEEKGQEIMDIVKNCKGDHVGAAKKIIERFHKEIINNYYSKDSSPVKQDSTEMSRESLSMNEGVFNNYLKVVKKIEIQEKRLKKYESGDDYNGLKVDSITKILKDLNQKENNYLSKFTAEDKEKWEEYFGVSFDS